MKMTKKINLTGDVVNDELGQLYDWIGLDAICPSKVHNFLDCGDGDDDDDNTEDVVVNLSSYGGDVTAASEIYTDLKSYAGKVTVNITGMAASAGSIIAMAGEVVNMSPISMMMIHQASMTLNGNTDDLSHYSDVLSKTDRGIASAYENKTGLSEAKILKMMSDETWLDAKSAKDLGFCDSIMFSNDDNDDGDDDEEVTDAKRLSLVASAHEMPNADKVHDLVKMVSAYKQLDNVVHERQQKREAEQAEMHKDFENMKKEVTKSLTQSKLDSLLND